MEASLEGEIVVADADEHARAVIGSLLADVWRHCEMVATGAEAIATVERRPPALVLLSVELTAPSGFEVLDRLRSSHGPSLPIAILAAADAARPRDEIAALLLGADDYFHKPIDADLFGVRVRRLVGVPGLRTARRRAERARHGLTRRELEVLALLVEGHRNGEIAERLCITPKTAATHIERILGKLGAHSQAQAVAFAVRDEVLAG